MSDTITLTIKTEGKDDKKKLSINAVINESQLAEIMRLLVTQDQAKQASPKFAGPNKLV